MTPVRMVRYVVLQGRQRRRVAKRGGLNQFLRIVGFMMLVVVLVIVGIGIGGVASVFGAYAYFTRDLPAPEQIEQADENFETTKIYDRTGQTLILSLIHI